MADQDNKRLTVGRTVAGTGRVSASVLRGIARLVIILAIITGGFLAGGFFYFSNAVLSDMPPSEITAVDGIVVLTGGPARIERGLELLKQNKGKRLLITGVNEATKEGDLQAINPRREDLFACCVDLDHAALNTVGNALETGKWLRGKGYTSIILVTSAQHMPRSLLEFERALDDVEITAYPVHSDGMLQDGWWRRPELLRPMISEYLKFLGARSRDYLEPSTLQALRANVLGS